MDSGTSGGTAADGARTRVLTEHALPASGQVLVVYAGGNDGGVRWALRPGGPAPPALVGDPVAARFVAHARAHGHAFVALGALPAVGVPPAVTLRVRRRLGPPRRVAITPAVVAGLLWVVEHPGDVVEVEVVAEGIRETRRL